MTSLTLFAGAASRSRSLQRVAIGVLFAGLLAAPAAVRAQDTKGGADTVVARVNGVEIRQSDVALAEEDLGKNVPAAAPEAKRDYIVTYLADIILAAQEAEKQKVPDAPAFKQRAAFVQKKLLMGYLLQTAAKDALTDEAMHKVYDDALKQVPAEQEVHARHILFRVADAKDEKASKEAEEKAKAVVVRLKKGEDFAKLAGELTEDPSGKGTGGDLGYFTKEQMVPEFAEAAFKLEKGQISEPVKSDFGWHVIKLEDKRQKPAPTFESVKDQIEQFLTQKTQAEMIAKLRKDAKIEKLYAVPEPKTDTKPADAEKK